MLLKEPQQTPKQPVLICYMCNYENKTKNVGQTQIESLPNKTFQV